MVENYTVSIYPVTFQKFNRLLTWIHHGPTPRLLDSESVPLSLLVLMNGTSAVTLYFVLRFDITIVDAILIL